MKLHKPRLNTFINRLFNTKNMLLGTLAWVALMFSLSTHAAVFSPSDIWPNDANSPYYFINICIDPDSAITDEDGDAVDADLGVTKDIVIGKLRHAVSKEYEANSRLRFVGWQECPHTPIDVVPVYIHANANNLASVGNQNTSTAADPLRHNRAVSFKPWGNDDDCLDNFDGPAGESDYKLYDCLEQYGLHEFGHVIGLRHTWKNINAPQGCLKVNPVEASTTDRSAYDRTSLMNYANDWDSGNCVDVNGVRFGSPVPTANDLAMIQKHYGSPIPNGIADIGVIPEAGQSCPKGTEVVIFMDNEDNANNNQHSGWLGDIPRKNDTTFTFCRVNPAHFKPFSSDFSQGSQEYAVLKLGQICPPASYDFTVTHDNEDFKMQDEGHHNNWAAGQLGPNATGQDTQLHFCLYQAGTANYSMDAFPQLGFEYGVLAAPDFLGAATGKTGYIYMDEEDNNNSNAFDYSGFDAIAITDTDALKTAVRNIVEVNEYGIKYHLAKANHYSIQTSSQEMRITTSSNMSMTANTDASLTFNPLNKNSNAQKWYFSANNEIVSVSNVNACLTPRYQYNLISKDNYFVLQQCGNILAQQWLRDGYNIRSITNPSICLTYDKSAPNNAHQLLVKQCNDSKEQRWFFDDGKLDHRKAAYYEQDAYLNEYTIKRDAYLYGTVKETTYGLSLEGCAKWCYHGPECESFVYKASNQQCEFKTGRLESTGSSTSYVSGVRKYTHKFHTHRGKLLTGLRTKKQYGMTMEQCARACFDDATCESFVSGGNDSCAFREGDLQTAAPADPYYTSAVLRKTYPFEFTDRRDGQSYKALTLGNDVWMAENLNYAGSSPGTTVGRCYDNNPANCNYYNRLYSFSEAKSTTQGNGKDICPTGWHLPTFSEWSDLMHFAGGAAQAGNYLKAYSALWSTLGPNEDYGFSAFPGGAYAFGQYSWEGINALFWNTDTNAQGKKLWYLENNSSNAGTYNLPAPGSASVRCVEDH